MKVSAKGEYGVRAMAILALEFHEGPLPLRVIAERKIFPYSFWSKYFTFAPCRLD